MGREVRTRPTQALSLQGFSGFAVVVNGVEDSAGMIGWVVGDPTTPIVSDHALWGNRHLAAK